MENSTRLAPEILEKGHTIHSRELHIIIIIILHIIWKTGLGKLQRGKGRMLDDGTSNDPCIQNFLL